METTVNQDCLKKKNPCSKFAIGIRIPGKKTSQQFDPQGLKLRVGEKVIVMTGFGETLGVVASNKVLNLNPE